MELKTPVTVAPTLPLSHADRIVSLGSCFADNIGKSLQDNGFRVEQNPFGTLYNPMSVINALQRLRLGTPFREEELFEYGGVYGSFAHHTSFSGRDKAEVLHHINETFNQAVAAFDEATCLMLTFGTSWVYALSETGRVVANCHKLPDYLFTRRRLETGEIVDWYREFFLSLFEEKPDMKVVFTVSPIRHFKDGAHENTLSKSVLHLAIDELCTEFDQAVYFPAYEILTDELRDYRFYDEDMLHPSALAVKYVWERFCDFSFDRETRDLMAQIQQIHKAMAHRPFRPDDESYIRFAQKNLAAVALLSAKAPGLDLNAERKFFEEQIGQ